MHWLSTFEYIYDDFGVLFCLGINCFPQEMDIINKYSVNVSASPSPLEGSISQTYSDVEAQTPFCLESRKKEFCWAGGGREEPRNKAALIRDPYRVRTRARETEWGAHISAHCGPSTSSPKTYDRRNTEFTGEPVKQIPGVRPSPERQKQMRSNTRSRTQTNIEPFGNSFLALKAMSYFLGTLDQ